MYETLLQMMLCGNFWDQSEGWKSSRGAFQREKGVLSRGVTTASPRVVGTWAGSWSIRFHSSSWWAEQRHARYLEPLVPNFSRCEFPGGWTRKMKWEEKAGCGLWRTLDGRSSNVWTAMPASPKRNADNYVSKNLKHSLQYIFYFMAVRYTQHKIHHVICKCQGSGIKYICIVIKRSAPSTSRTSPSSQREVSLWAATLHSPPSGPANHLSVVGLGASVVAAPSHNQNNAGAALRVCRGSLSVTCRGSPAS